MRFRNDSGRPVSPTNHPVHVLQGAARCDPTSATGGNLITPYSSLPYTPGEGGGLRRGVGGL